MIKVAIVDDHTLFRKGLLFLIKEWPGVEVCIEAESGIDLLEKISEHPVDVVLLDLHMPGMNGIKTCEILRDEYPNTKILILTYSVKKLDILNVMSYGADGYFTKGSNPDELFKAIQNIHNGGFHFEKSLYELIENIRLNKKSLTARAKIDISRRELEIIKLYAKEYNGKQIADMLNISLRTVETHKKNLMAKTNSKNFIGVIIFSLETQTISLSEFIRKPSSKFIL